MTSVVQQELDQMIQSEWEYINSRRQEWSLLEGDQDLEVLEHVLRCILHLGFAEECPPGVY